MTKKTKKNIIGFIIKFMIALVFLAPFFLSISYSFRTDTEIMMTKGVTLLPRKPTWENYGWVFKHVAIFTYLKNSILHYVLIMGARAPIIST